MKKDCKHTPPAIEEEWRPAVVLVWKDTRGRTGCRPALPEVDPSADDDVYIQDEF
ncbi:hypothetical protein SXCC_02209 [Gluconacetobacter sp. SXCC-1]|mgnify:CR=1 FL=1|uniref:Uncharacterized protein n=1 Tax=Komagataeibacter rhaeticus TaxID=215221 RepID=A0A181C9Q2_9PROT|nr:hypothetical protein [Komagataeibacter rhaeticus]EGG76998.1 hypothetical protein SXCC_02209 [Gluconacetobacter sp. SXCC-1]MBL7241398.1 hypothetical protein [Komagataeibacter rhaeticus]QIP35133.1 hypothetical protein GWK63_06280 [Komagataeibacter rhaeticus]QOC47688.1 hypothetical protein ICJ78_06350 [Komagataeibacter rhaeticus]WPP22951.1 hypothetical protein SCD25_05570 [Komagataeibacter rhaeticus]